MPASVFPHIHVRFHTDEWHHWPGRGRPEFQVSSDVDLSSRSETPPYGSQSISRYFPYGSAWSRSRLELLPIVTAAPLPVSSAWRFFAFCSCFENWLAWLRPFGRPPGRNGGVNSLATAFALVNLINRMSQLHAVVVSPAARYGPGSRQTTAAARRLRPVGTSRTSHAVRPSPRS